MSAFVRRTAGEMQGNMVPVNGAQAEECSKTNIFILPVLEQKIWKFEVKA